MNALLVLPILIPLATTVACLLAWRARRVQRVLSIAGAAALFAAAVALLARLWDGDIQVMQSGAWPAPFGISLVADLFSGIMVLLAAMKGLAVVIYSLGDIDVRRESFGYHPLFHALLMGICGAFLTGDMFNLYVWFEVMLMASFVLLALGGERAQLEGAIKYFTLNLLSSMIFLAAVGLLYGMIGTLNMADLAVKVQEDERRGLLTTISMLFLVAFGVKAGLFPLFFWLPASYHTPPAAIAAIFAGLLTKVGVYAIIRVFSLVFIGPGSDQTLALFLALAGLTMVTGVLGAASQMEFRRILSFHIISQIGYMIMGLGLFSRLALAGSIFYIMHHIVVKTNLFLVSGVAAKLRAGAYDLRRLGGLYHTNPGLAVLFLIPALSLAGIPPLSGFFAKLILIKAGLDQESYLIVGVALAVGLLTLFSMTKIWAEAFWKPDPDEDNPFTLDPEQRPRLTLMLVPIALLAAVTVAIGLGARPVFHLAQRAADQILDREQYIEAVRPEGIR